MSPQTSTADPDSFARSLRSLSRRWTLDILDLLLENPRRFSEIRHAIPGLSERVMWERLRELTEVGLIVRQVDPGPPIKSTYMATSRAAEVQLRIDELRTALGHTISGAEPT
ncbi:MAG: helix-turn-helix transcriptional regulator [Actinomycetota bacterium]|nr:helix-turn-helix transcriptional regulator [Actinomycetota bacterium]